MLHVERCGEPAADTFAPEPGIGGAAPIGPAMPRFSSRLARGRGLRSR